jgi:hypothetical protein
MSLSGRNATELLPERQLLIVGLYEAMSHGESLTKLQMYSTVLRASNVEWPEVHSRESQMFGRE